MNWPLTTFSLFCSFPSPPSLLYLFPQQAFQPLLSQQHSSFSLNIIILLISLMGEDSQRHHDQDDHQHTRGFTKGSSIKEMCKAYKSLVNRWYPDHKSPSSKSPSGKGEKDDKFNDLDKTYKRINSMKQEEKSRRKDKPSKREKSNRLSMDDSTFSTSFFPKSPSTRRSTTPSARPTYLSNIPSKKLNFSLSRTFSRTSRSAKAESPSFSPPSVGQNSPSPALSRSMSRKCTTSENETCKISRSTSKRSISTPSKNENRSISRSKSRRSTPLSENEMHNISRSTSRRSTTPSENETCNISRSTSGRSTTPIIYSQSIARRKPAPVEKKLECTLEELCNGGLKKIKVTRYVISEAGIIVQEEETLTINLKPGWTEGTKVTFEGKGDERPGYLPADIIFLIEEKRHPLFKRQGDDLEIAVEIPLVKALTGCSLSVPLLGGKTMKAHFDEVIYPGYEKVIEGQGMPNARGGKRGDLRITFLVNFPTELTYQQRSEACNILKDCSFDFPD